MLEDSRSLEEEEELRKAHNPGQIPEPDQAAERVVVTADIRGRTDLWCEADIRLREGECQRDAAR